MVQSKDGFENILQPLLESPIWDLVSVGFLVVDSSARIVFLNQVIENIFGYGKNQLIGQPVSDLVPEMLRDKHVELEQDYIHNPRQRIMGQSNSVDLTGQKKDGSCFPLSIGLSPVEHNGQTMVLATIADMSQRLAEMQLSLQSFRAITDSAMDAVISADLEGKIIYCNHAAARKFGYSINELIGQSLTILIPEHYKDAHNKAFAVSAREQTVRLVGKLLELEGLRKDGTLFPLELSISPWLQGRQISLTAFIRDISVRKEAQLRIKQFYSMISHELRTPLTSIRGGLCVVDDGIVDWDSDEAKEMVSVATSSTERLLRLIDDILDLHKIDAGKLEMRLESIDVAQLLAESLSIMGSFAKERDVLLQCTGAEVQSIYADYGRLLQVLTNLISNAVKFSPTGSNVTVSAKSAEPDSIIFSVSDSGPGISADDQEKLFQVFQQLDSSDTRSHEGSGLGLAICKAIVEQYGGQIRVDSQLGAGSKFSFAIPVTAPDD